MLKAIEYLPGYRLGKHLVNKGQRGLTQAARISMAILQPQVTRRMVEVRESLFLSPYARKSIDSLGRERTEKPCPYRTVFARDRDRILHSLFFMLLGGKTQVFSAEALSLPEKIYIHNRLFHVLKVAQIARDICRALGLNEDLAEAIALGHDLGHSPFGHEGEKILNELSMKHLGVPFKHNRQGLRVIDILEKLNLTHEVRDGIVRHDGEKKDPIIRPSTDLTLSDSEFPITLEACVVRLADRIAYLPTDLEDGLILKIVTEEQIPQIVRAFLGANAGQIIDTLVKDVIASSRGKNYITMSQDSLRALDALYEFNYENIYHSEINATWIKGVRDCVEGLYLRYTRREWKKPWEAIDIIAKMTDEQALAEWEKVKSAL